MTYLHWDETTIIDFSEKNISAMYDCGYVFTRIGKGVMQQTRSVRIDLSKFELTSENRRILKKAALDGFETISTPWAHYDLRVGKLAKDFYTAKFGPNIMSAFKVKEMMTNPARNNFNEVLIFSSDSTAIGWTICYKNTELLHYSYPFYDLNVSSKDMGLGMMIRAIQYARDSDVKYAYLGSLQRPGDTYKLQFAGLEWFDGGPDGSNKWSTDIDRAKRILSSATLES